MNLSYFVDGYHYAERHEVELLYTLALLMFVTGFIVFCILLFQPATYGRYSNTSKFYSIGIPPRLAWFLQEAPAFFIPCICVFLTQQNYLSGVYTRWQLIVLSCYVLHYFHRTFIYSFKIKGGKPTPLYAFTLALLFCSGNGYMQSRGAVLLSNYEEDNWSKIRLMVGVGLFFAGMFINIHSDHVLRNLRKPGECGYKIPHGGLFNFVSCANFFGEVVEWIGFAVASHSVVAWAFAFFTVANLAPRAFTHHRWYLQKFDDYPKDRKALLPYII